MSDDKIKIGARRNPQEVEGMDNSIQRKKSPDEIRAIIEALKNQQELQPSDYPTVLERLGISKEEYEPILGPAPQQSQPVVNQMPQQPMVQEKKQEPVAVKNSGNYNIDSRSIHQTDRLFEAPTEEIELPSKGMFYKNKKATVKIKHLTAEADDILFTEELYLKNQQLNALLENSVIDKDIRPSEMLIGDRNYVLIELRRTGFGDDYKVDPMRCNSCLNVFNPTVDLSKIKKKEVSELPDEEGLFYIKLPVSKAEVKFRLLTGDDEMVLQQQNSVAIGTGTFKVKKMYTQKYVLQIMSVNGITDKIFIKSFVEAMPLKDSRIFRDYSNKVDPGIDFFYNFKCPHCGAEEKRLIPFGLSLFYPDEA